MNLTGVRIVVGILLAAAISVGSLPLLILLDLARGGTGFGLCPSGLTSCHNPYSAAPELSFALTIALFALVLALRVTMRTLRRMERLEAQQHRFSGLSANRRS